jgi:signal transduction histidine kinase
VLALQANVGLLVVVDRDGAPIASFSRSAPDATPVPTPSGPWSVEQPVRDALASGTAGRWSGVLRRDGQALLVTAAAVCSTPDACAPVGAAIAALDLSTLTGPCVAVYDAAGELLAQGTRAAAPTHAPPVPAGRLARRQGRDATSLYAPFDLDGRRAATIAVRAPTRPAFAGVRSAAWRIAFVVAAAILGAAGIVLAQSRFILAQVRPLLETNRSLGAGDLSARAPVLGRDELGELAEGVNQMAARLQASYETLEDRVRDRTEEVERLLQERTDLFTSVSHEFRTPLAVILSQAESLQDASYAKTAAWCADVGRMVEQSGRQLLAFVNDILDLARAESEGLEVELGPVDLPALLAAVRPSLTALATAAGVRFAARVPRTLTPVVADHERLREVIVNLVDNAVKYTPSGGRVTVAASNGAGRVVVTVADTGIGIPTEVGDRVFEPFYRVQGSRTQHAEPSSGLGLAVTRRLVEAQGGTIEYAPGPKGGTTFTVTLRAGDHPA